jgi:hypothetical protein
MKSLALPLLLLALDSPAQVTQPLIEAIIRVESSGRASATGDGGSAIGLAQFHRASWLDTSAFRSSKGLPAYPYEYASQGWASRAYLHSWLTLNADRFRADRGRNPTPGELYAIHNLGYGGFQKRGFEIPRCPSITRRKAALITASLDNK